VLAWRGGHHETSNTTCRTEDGAFHLPSADLESVRHDHNETGGRFMKLPLIGAVVVCAMAIDAGPGLAQMMTMGVSGGATLSDVSAQADGAAIDTKSRTGFNAAGILGVEATPVLDIQIRGQLTMKGFDLEAQQGGVETGLKLLYLDFPLLAVFTIPLGSNSMVAPRIFAGPSLGLRITCSLTEGAGPVGTGECDPDKAGTLDFGALAGVGVKFGKGRGGLILDASINYGLTNIDKSNSGLSVKNRAFMVSLGYLFPII